MNPLRLLNWPSLAVEVSPLEPDRIFEYSYSLISSETQKSLRNTRGGSIAILII